MRFEFDAAGKHVAFVDALEPDYQDARAEKDLLAARRLVRSASWSPTKSAELRAFVVKAENTQGASALSPAEVQDRLAWKLVRGELRVEQAGSKSVVLPSAVPPPAAVAAPPKKKDEASKLTWIAVELVGEDDAPIPGEEYEIELPGGDVQRGTLGADGRATLRAILPGTCKVRFPGLDAEAVEPA